MTHETVARIVRERLGIAPGKQAITLTEAKRIHDEVQAVKRELNPLRRALA